MAHNECKFNTGIRSKKKSYSDLEFKLKKSKSGKIKVLEDGDCIIQSIKTILSTNLGERVMLPHFGSSFKSLLFEPMDLGTRQLLELEVEQSINRWEDRVSVTDVVITENIDQQSYVVSIVFVIVDTGSVDEFVATVRKL